jgi:hypothetical protein|tara:strand:- start:27374 stop:27694 length:321 start_codon:yes stop_codon:yes gene_type:complete
MANGVLGRVSLASTTLTTVYTVPVSTLAYVNINVANRTASNAAVRIALAQTAGSPSDAEYIEYDSFVAPNGVIERTGLVIDAGWSVVAFSDKANVSVQAYGIEQTS